MPMISYAQNREDVLLDRLFPRAVKGFYIDVGAASPDDGSVTKHFYDLGWDGVNVEPSATFADLVAARPRDVNLNVGLSDQPGDLTLYEFAAPLTSASTFDAAQAQRHHDTGLEYVEREIPVTTLAQVCEEHVGDRTISFLSIDVEGHERSVLEGADFSRWRPIVVVVEATQPRTTAWAGSFIPTHDEWEPILIKADYVFATFDGLNRYYVRAEDSALADVLAVPVNVNDDYVPHELSRQIEQYRWLLEASQRQLAATRVMNDTLKAERDAFGPGLSLLRAEYERQDRSLTNLRAQYEAVRTSLVEARLQYEQLLPEVVRVRTETQAAQAALDAAGSGGLAVARQVTALSARHPEAATAVKRGVRVAKAIRRRLLRRG
ncbi:MAG: hypothetical protein QOE93_354 [Actinomycetota bacterium]|jgi:FkbM family methyltransferase|nr:hypothetical protein [Actinomycetota bacterium]